MLVDGASAEWTVSWREPSAGDASGTPLVATGTVEIDTDAENLSPRSGQGAVAADFDHYQVGGDGEGHARVLASEARCSWW